MSIMGVSSALKCNLRDQTSVLKLEGQGDSIPSTLFYDFDDDSTVSVSAGSGL
jgi:hypothetical protein